MSIRQKLAMIIFSVSFITAVLGYSGFIYWYMQKQYNDSIKLSQTISNVVSYHVSELILSNNKLVISDINNIVKSFDLLNQLTIYNLDKKKVYTYYKNNYQKNKVDFNNLNKIILDKRYIHILTKIKYKDMQIGYAYVTFCYHNVKEIILENIKVLILISIIILLISYILSIYWARRFTKPIFNLLSFFKNFDIDNFKSLKVKGKDEYAKLYKEINKILLKLHKNYKSLKIASVVFEAQSAMAITDKNRKILDVNKSFCKITGYSKKEVIGKNPRILKSGLHDKEFYKNMYDSLEKNSYWAGEITNRNKQGKLYNEYLMIYAILDKNNNIEYYVASAIDITLQRKIEIELKEKEEMLIQQSKMASFGEMLENIVHQWKQPLSIISLSASEILFKKEMGVSKEEDEIKSLEQINSTIKYLTDTIDDFKNFFKPNKEKTSFNLLNLYNRTFNMLKKVFSKLDIKIIVNIPEDIFLYGFENEFRQVLINILSNAKDALENKEEKYLFIEAVNLDDTIEINIYDNAGGIDENIINNIFEQHFTTKKKGSGIGLYMSYKIITEHFNGIIEVNNYKFNYNNQDFFGAKFTIRLPKDNFI